MANEPSTIIYEIYKHDESLRRFLYPLADEGKIKLFDTTLSFYAEWVSNGELIGLLSDNDYELFLIQPSENGHYWYWRKS